MTPASTDLLVIGGGPAGLSAATMFSRLRRPCIIYDSGVYRNGASPAAHTILGVDGIDPEEYRARARKDLEAYSTCTYRRGKVTSLKVLDDGRFLAKDGEGREIEARKVIMATGLADKMPDIPGAQEAWGKRLIHCVFCHGTETAFGSMGFILTQPNKAMNPMMADTIFKLWGNLKHEKVYFLTHGMDMETEEGRKDSGLEKWLPVIKAKGYQIISSRITSITQAPDSLTFNFESHAPLTIPFALIFPEKMHPNADALPLLTSDILGGTSLTPFGTIPPVAPDSTMGEWIKTHPGAPRMGDDPRTNVPGVFWAGCSGSMMANVALSTAQGAMAGAMAGDELGKEDTDKALQDLAGTS